MEALASSQRLGLLGDAPIDDIIEHATAFVDALVGVSGTVVDLGSGGGVPGLVIAEARADLWLVLVDRRSSCADHLRRLVGRLALGDRVTVLACDAAQAPSMLDSVDAVVARGFAAPETTAAAGVRLLRDGGRLVISEPPPGTPERWRPAFLAGHGLHRVPHADARVAVFEFHVEPLSGHDEVPRETEDA